MPDQTIKIDKEIYKRILALKKEFKIPIRYIVELAIERLEISYGKKPAKR